MPLSLHQTQPMVRPSSIYPQLEAGTSFLGHQPYGRADAAAEIVGGSVLPAMSSTPGSYKDCAVRFWHRSTPPASGLSCVQGGTGRQATPWAKLLSSGPMTWPSAYLRPSGTHGGDQVGKDPRRSRKRQKRRLHGEASSISARCGRASPWC